MIYAKNIARDDDESDDQVKDRVRKFVRRKRDVRIISIQVVHNKYCEDTVGCKLCIPTSAQEILMAPGFWPEDVECREWSRKRQPRQGYGDRDTGTNWDRSGRHERRQNDGYREVRDHSEFVYRYSRDNHDYPNDDRHYSDEHHVNNQRTRDDEPPADWWEDDVREHREAYSDTHGY